MKVLGIHSSHAEGGSTATLLREALAGAASAGADTEEVALLPLGLKFCRGCMGCLKRGSCAQEDGLETIRAKMLEADAIVLASPSYGLAPSASMVNFLQRVGLFAAYSSQFAGKYFAGISTAGAMGHAQVAKALCGLANGAFSRGYVVRTLGAPVGWEGIGRGSPAALEARKLGAELVAAVAARRSYPLQAILPRFVNRAFVRPMMAKNILAHRSEMAGVIAWHEKAGRALARL